MLEIRDAGGVTRLVNVAAIVEVSPAYGPDDDQTTRIVLRNGVEHVLPMSYAVFRVRLSRVLSVAIVDAEVPS